MAIRFRPFDFIAPIICLIIWLSNLSILILMKVIPETRRAH